MRKNLTILLLYGQTSAIFISTGFFSCLTDWAWFLDVLQFWWASQANNQNLYVFPQLQTVWCQPTSLSGRSPASDPRNLACWEVKGGGGQTDGPDVLVEFDFSVQLHQGNVIVVGHGVVAFMGDDPLYVPPHSPFVDLALHMQTQQGLPLVCF